MKAEPQLGNFKKALVEGALYGITDLHFQFESHLVCAQRLIEAGVQLIQYRGKELDPLIQRQELEILVPWAKERGATVIVNDQVQLAQQVGAAGVHLGQGDQSVTEARVLLGPKALIGLSTHTLEQVKEAEGLGVDYIGVGPAYKTATKPQEPTAGLGFLESAAGNSTLAQVAIGGITEARLSEVLQTGQTSVAIISDLLSAPDLEQKVLRIKGQLAGH